MNAGEKLTADASGKVKAGRKSYRLKPQTTEVGAGQRKSIELVPQRGRNERRIARELKRGRRARAAKATVTVKLTDTAGNTKTQKLRVKLKR